MAARWALLGLVLGCGGKDTDSGPGPDTDTSPGTTDPVPAGEVLLFTSIFEPGPSEVLVGPDQPVATLDGFVFQGKEFDDREFLGPTLIGRPYDYLDLQLVNRTDTSVQIVADNALEPYGANAGAEPITMGPNATHKYGWRAPPDPGLWFYTARDPAQVDAGLLGVALTLGEDFELATLSTLINLIITPLPSDRVVLPDTATAVPEVALVVQKVTHGTFRSGGADGRRHGSSINEYLCDTMENAIAEVGTGDLVRVNVISRVDATLQMSVPFTDPVTGKTVSELELVPGSGRYFVLDTSAAGEVMASVPEWGVSGSIVVR